MQTISRKVSGGEMIQSSASGQVYVMRKIDGLDYVLVSIANSNIKNLEQELAKLKETIESWEAAYNNLIDENDKIKKELRETIEKQKKEIEALKKELETTSIRRGYELIKQKDKAIAEAREIILESRPNCDLMSNISQWIEKAKAWLEQNK